MEQKWLKLIEKSHRYGQLASLADLLPPTKRPIRPSSNEMDYRIKGGRVIIEVRGGYGRGQSHRGKSGLWITQG